MKKVVMIVAIAGALVLLSVPSNATPARFSIMASAEGTKIAFPYLLSLPDPDVPTGWVAGDRVGYGCAYAFLRSGGRVVARVTFTRIEYAKVNDKYMDEGARFYDGTVYTGPNRQLDDCPGPTEPYVEATGPIGPLPKVTFAEASTGQVLEVRDYTKLVQAGDGIPWEFQIVSATPERVSVVAYQSREPVLAIYYDRLSPRITLSSNSAVVGSQTLSSSAAPKPSPFSMFMSWGAAWLWARATHRRRV